MIVMDGLVWTEGVELQSLQQRFLVEVIFIIHKEWADPIFLNHSEKFS